MDSHDSVSVPSTVTEPPRTTFTFIWRAPEGCARRQFAHLFALRVLGSGRSAFQLVIYKTVIDVFSGAAAPPAILTPGLPECGKHDQLIEAEGAYAALWRAQNAESKWVPSPSGWVA